MSLPKGSIPCRLFIILAREAPLAVIIRRGPSKWHHIIKWNTDSDTFEPGAWFHGQFHPERSDISPDGTRLIYFATDYSFRNRGKGFPNAWTAISKVPWLTALAVWPNFSTYFGGGLFETDTRIWVNPDHQNSKPLAGYQPQGLEISYDHPFFDHNWHWIFRIEQAGWQVVQPYPAGSIPVYRIGPDGSYNMETTDPNCQLGIVPDAVHERVQPHGSLALLMTSTYVLSEGKIHQMFIVKDDLRRISIRIEGAVWVEWDTQGRLVYTKEGKLFAGEITTSGELVSHELADFNNVKPERTKSPDWARVW